MIHSKQNRHGVFFTPFFRPLAFDMVGVSVLHKNQNIVFIIEREHNNVIPVIPCGYLVLPGCFLADPTAFHKLYGRITHYNLLLRKPLVSLRNIIVFQMKSKISRHFYKMTGFHATRPETMKHSTFKIDGKCLSMVFALLKLQAMVFLWFARRRL